MLKTKPCALPYIRHRQPGVRPRTQVSYTPPQIAALYQFPTGVTGAGQAVGIIELGGALSQTDFNAYMKALGLPAQTVTVIPVNGATITPDPGGADVEVMLDVEVIGAVAPGAKIRVYFADNTSAGFVAAIRQARLDGCSIISISWGSPEDNWSAADRAAMDAEFASCVGAGVTVFVAAGDNGSSDGESSGNHVDFPAASPYVVGCGGTSLVASNGVILTESVWNDGTRGGATGGGVSVDEALPAWQQGHGIPGNGRGVPDMAGVADPETGYVIIANGQQGVIGGTSAVAPLFAGLAALLNQALGSSIGYFNPKIYELRVAFRDIVQGNNGTYAAKAGWDGCTGLGVPIGSMLLTALQVGTTPTPPQPPTPIPTPTPTPVPVPVTVPSPDWPSVKAMIHKVMQRDEAFPIVGEIFVRIEAKLDTALAPMWPQS